MRCSLLLRDFHDNRYVIGDFRDVALHKNQLFWAMQEACGAFFAPDDRYAFDSAENPLVTGNLHTIVPGVSYPENGALACNAMAATAEQHLAERQYQMAQQGFNLRLGALQALYGRRPGGRAGGMRHEIPLLLSRLAEVHLGLDDSSTASRCSEEAVRQAPRFHVTSARALETHMRVLFARGDRKGALAAPVTRLFCLWNMLLAGVLVWQNNVPWAVILTTALDYAPLFRPHMLSCQV